MIRTLHVLDHSIPLHSGYTFRTAALLQPWVVINGNPDSLFLPSHLAAQGFYQLRARTQLREIRDILLK